MNHPAPAKHTALCAGLRQLADFFEAHPEVPMPKRWELNVYSFGEPENLDMARRIATALGTFKKTASTNFILEKDFGSIDLRFVLYRASVCEKIVVGTRTVRKAVAPTNTVMEMQDVVEDIVEWHCPPLLADGGDVIDGESELLPAQPAITAETKERDDDDEILF